MSEKATSSSGSSDSGCLMLVLILLLLNTCDTASSSDIESLRRDCRIEHGVY